LLPVLGMCALPFALIPVFQPTTATRTWRISGLLLGTVQVVSLLLWLDLFNGLTGLGTRNSQPFGHANITGSVSALAATWLAGGASRETGRIRVLFILGSAVSIANAVSSESRGAVLALAAGVVAAAAITLLKRRRFLGFALLMIVLTGGVIAVNAPLRTLVLHGRWSASSQGSNDQRTAMLIGGLRLGAERPLLGWGAGSIPHVFPRVRGGLPGTADNVVQLHNTPVQLWATLGFAGLFAGVLITTTIVRHTRATPWTPERIALASGLAASVTVLLFDHPFATPIFAMLAASHLVVWAAQPNATTTVRLPSLIALGGGLLLIPAMMGSVRDLTARSAFAEALNQASADNREGYVSSLRRAAIIAPDDPYYAHLLAAHLVTGHPFAAPHSTAQPEAISLLEHTLAANPDLEYAHYNLGWLLLDSDPSASVAHFMRSAHLAPQRGAVYLGLGLARIRLNDTDGAVRAFAAEWLLDPVTAWSPIWSQPPLDTLQPRIHALATATLSARYMEAPWAKLDTLVSMGAPYRRLRTGYGVLMGHPEGMPPVDFNIQAKVILPAELLPVVPAFGWIRGQVLLDFLKSPAPR
jgi:O-antigen ligase